MSSRAGFEEIVVHCDLAFDFRLVFERIGWAEPLFKMLSVGCS